MRVTASSRRHVFVTHVPVHTPNLIALPVLPQISGRLSLRLAKAQYPNPIQILQKSLVDFCPARLRVNRHGKIAPTLSSELRVQSLRSENEENEENGENECGRLACNQENQQNLVAKSTHLKFRLWSSELRWSTSKR